MSIKDRFEKLFNNEFSTQEARDFLIDLAHKGETSKDIAIAALVMREHSIKLNLSDELQKKAIDVVGTGGDKSGSFNISTTVSLLLASMGRVVAKHGNRSITSNSGSTDVLEALGINLDLSIDNKIKMLEESGFCFFPATDHHPAMKHIMPIRKSIEHRTIFNILGPLTNPASIKKYLLGVFDPSYVKVIAKALLELNAKRAFVVSSHDGMDELSLSTRSSFAYIESNHIVEGEIDPQSLGLTLVSKDKILGGDAKFNAQITRNIFAGVSTKAQREIVALNASFALFISDDNIRDIEEALEMVNSALDSKMALKHLEFMVNLSHKLV